MPRRRTIDRTFSRDRSRRFWQRSTGSRSKVTDQAQWSARTAQTIRSKSPTSLKLALAQMRYGAHPFASRPAWRAEFRIVSRIVYGHDMIEGVRAVIVDKDNEPRWSPATPRRGVG